jgi:transposase-like protein
MVVIAVVCPHCKSNQVIKRGKTAGGKQRYRCLNPDCSHSSLVLNPAYTGRLPEVKQKIVDMALHGSGVPDHLGDSLTC